MVNYVLETTGQTELFYAGHSQGTVMGFAGFTVNQTLAKQIKAFFALAPVTTVKHIEGVLKPLADIYDVIYVSEGSDTLAAACRLVGWVKVVVFESVYSNSNNTGLLQLVSAGNGNTHTHRC